MRCLKVFCILILYFTSANLHAQFLKAGKFIEAELLGGYIVPNHLNYPSIGPRTGVHLNIGKINHESESEWGALYNGPASGVTFGFSPTGNSDIFGYEISFNPYIELWSNNFMKRLKLRLALGGSYFTKRHDEIENPRNLALGSRLAWNFKAFAYLKLAETERVSYRFGFGAYHSSNGHVQLPNFGLNSAMLSLSARFKSSSPVNYGQPLPIDKRKHYFMSFNTGAGFHEFGGTEGSDIKSKKGVYSASLALGVIYQQFIKVRTGLTYRFYQHYHDYILASVPEYLPKINSYSSNVFVFLGAEFLLGRVGMNVEGGINLHKPFYSDFYEFFEGRSQMDFILKNIFPASLGINYYLINPSKKPKNNVFLGANIRANFGQADFSDVVVGYTHRFN